MGGGGGGLNVPKEIWSPTGGFFADPRKWKRNTVVTVAAMAAIAAYAASLSVKMETRHRQPNSPIPSERFYTAANFPQQQQQ